MQLREYQRQAIDATYDCLRRGVRRPLIVAPTGSGKSPIIGTLAHEISRWYPVVIAVHTQDLLGQLIETYKAISGKAPAVWAASHNRRDVGPVTFAQIQSVYENAEAFRNLAPRALVVDECHTIPEDEGSRYQTFINGLSQHRTDLATIGLTATPYRLGQGTLIGTQFDEIAHNIRISDLMKQGYLCPVTATEGDAPDLTGLHTRAGDYIETELEALMADPEKVAKACSDMVRRTTGRKCGIVFVTSVKHGEMVRDHLVGLNKKVDLLTGATPKGERQRLIAAHRNGELDALINVNVLTTGYDCPRIDWVGMLRPTKSAGLYYQQVGRMLRTHPDKLNGLLLDYAGNIHEHGPIDTLNDRIREKEENTGDGQAPMRTCPKCQHIQLAALAVCGSCGYRFPRSVARHDTFASTADVLACTADNVKKVDSWRFTVCPGKQGKPSLLEVRYVCGTQVFVERLSVDQAAYGNARHWASVWLDQTPQDPKRLTCVNGTFVADGTTPLLHARDWLPFTSCLKPPTHVVVLLEGQWPKVVRRVWKAET